MLLLVIGLAFSTGAQENPVGADATSNRPVAAQPATCESKWPSGVPKFVPHHTRRDDEHPPASGPYVEWFAYFERPRGDLNRLLRHRVTQMERDVGQCWTKYASCVRPFDDNFIINFVGKLHETRPPTIHPITVRTSAEDQLAGCVLDLVAQSIVDVRGSGKMYGKGGFVPRGEWRVGRAGSPNP